MSETIDQIASDLRSRVEGWLNAPDEASAGLDELRERLQALGATIGTSAKNDALRALAGSEKDIRRSRQREAADTIAAALRPLGVVLVAQAPPKRQRKVKPHAEPTAPKNEEPRAPTTQASSSDEGAPVGESKKGGGLHGLGRRAV